MIEVSSHQIEFLARQFERRFAEQQTERRRVGQRDVDNGLCGPHRIAHLVAAAGFRLLAALARSYCVVIDLRRRLLKRRTGPVRAEWSSNG